MTPDKWDQLRVLFQALQASPEAERAKILSECGDPDIRAELERLINEHDHLSKVLDQPVADAPVDKELINGTLGRGEPLGARYRIVQFIGKGGMGEVYEAEDLELDTRIAIKILHQKLPPQGRPLERFKQEILLGRRITHPNVCRIFDIGRANVPERGEPLFLTMELLIGETLSERLQHKGAMKTNEALPLATQMIAGLAACHERGIVHRDFKSSNVILVAAPAGTPRVVVTDLGLAYSVEQDERAGPLLTATGCIVGTPAYMAPEQVEGKPVTERTDIYSLGVVLCEMITGQRPIPYWRENRGQAKRDPFQGAAVDAKWHATILQCLETEPSRRFARVTDVSKALDMSSALTEGTTLLLPVAKPATSSRKLIIGTSALILLTLGAIALWLSRKPPNIVPELKHVAVLQFRNVGKNPADDVFCDGLMETLSSKLSQLERFQKSYWVVPASESRRLSDPMAAFPKLGATLVVYGSLERGPLKTVLTVNLIDARSHRQLASRVIEGLEKDLSNLEDQAWEQVADMLDLQLGREVIRTLDAGKAHMPGAYEYYEQGLGYLRRDGASNWDNAILLFQKSIERDPSYALPHAALASAYNLKYEATKDTQCLRAAETHVKRARELGPTLPEVRLTSGEVYYATGQHENAERDLREALMLDPGMIEAHFYLGRLHEDQGDIRQAETDLQSVVDRRPGYWRAHSELARFYYSHGKWDQAEREFKEVLNLQPDDIAVYANLGALYVAQGQLVKAVETFQKEISVQPSARAYTNLGTSLIWLGKYAEAVSPMESATKLDPEDHDMWRNLGDAYRLAPGQSEKAVAAYLRATELAEKLLALNPKDADTVASLALYEAHLNKREEALRLAAQVKRMASSNNDVLFTIGLTYEILGQRADALQMFGLAYERGYSLEYIELEPELIELRKDSRYIQWKRRVTTQRQSGDRRE